MCVRPPWIALLNGEFERAISLILSRKRTSIPLAIEDQFNLAMAIWGRDRVVPTTEFEKVLDPSRGPAEPGGANFHQCLAVASWAAHDAEGAMKHLAKSRAKIAQSAWAEVSCWRYLRVAVGDFKRDLDAIEALIGGASVLPLFMV